MNDFNYRNGKLFCEDVAIEDIAAKVGSPAYIYSEAKLKSNYNELKEAFSEIDPLVCFSVKSLPNLSVLALLSELGCGMDVVSGGEYFRSITAGAKKESIVFAGVGKSHRDIETALATGVLVFNAESLSEVSRIESIAHSLGKVAKVSLRVNPDVVDPRTPSKTATGGRNSKFGVPINQALPVFRRFRKSENISLNGVHIHLGSPIPSSETYLRAINLLIQLIREIEKDGGEINMVDLGGGFPAQYEQKSSGESLKKFASEICAAVRPLRRPGRTFVIEPGRSIAATAGILIAKVEYVKDGWDQRTVVLDAGMNALIRPTLYNAYHHILPVALAKPITGSWRVIDTEALSRLENVNLTADIVGPICETGDYFALGRDFPEVAEGDLVSIYCAGAYGMTMASQYNSHPRPPEILVGGDEFRIIRDRETLSNLIESEYIPL